jgi:ABC-type molybdate transport system substrate-binding protein
MTRLLIRAASASLALQVMGCAMAQAAEIKVLSAVGMREVMLDLGPRFERATGHTLQWRSMRVASSLDESSLVKRSTSS